MAKQTKLEASLQVFEDKLKELSVRIETCVALEKKLDTRIAEMDSKKINVDYSAFNSAIEQSKSVFESFFLFERHQFQFSLGWLA